MKRTNDKEILEMLEQGKSQKEIAAYFGVSPPYICKRVKLLLAKDIPESLSNLTEKEKRFVIEKATGATNTEAALRSYEVGSRESAKVIGSQLMAKEQIITAIEDLMELEGMDRRYRIKKLKRCIDHPDPNVTLKALDQSWKLDGSYAAEKVEIDSTQQILAVHAELEARSEKLKHLLEKLRQGRETGDDPTEDNEVEN